MKKSNKQTMQATSRRRHQQRERAKITRQPRWKKISIRDNGEKLKPKEKVLRREARTKDLVEDGKKKEDVKEKKSLRCLNKGSGSFVYLA